MECIKLQMYLWRLLNPGELGYFVHDRNEEINQIYRLLQVYCKILKLRIKMKSKNIQALSLEFQNKARQWQYSRIQKQLHVPQVHTLLT